MQLRDMAQLTVFALFVGVSLLVKAQTEDLHGERLPKREQQASNSPSMLRAAEVELQIQGYQVGEIDGRYDPKTREALEKFQKQHGLQATGALNAETASALELDEERPEILPQQAPHRPENKATYEDPKGRQYSE